MEQLMPYEVTDESQNFTIADDEAAEWALLKIAEDRAEAQRLINACNSMILKYQERIQKIEEDLKHKTGFLQGKLYEYFCAVPHKKTKTTETYALPSGKLKLKYPGPEYVRDDEKLVEWLKKMGHTDYVKTVEMPVWGEFKKTTEVHKDPIVDEETGEITGYDTYVTDAKGIKVGGVTLAERPPVFEVEV